MVFNETVMEPFFWVLEQNEGVMQHPLYHPEGDVFTHSLQALYIAFRETNDTEDWAKEHQDIFSAFAQSLRDHLGNRLCEMDAICLEPYHEHSFPITFKQGAWLHWKRD